MKVTGALLSTLWLAAVDANTCQPSGPFTGTPFSYIPPENTTVLTPYGESPAVHPSRE